MTKPTSIAEICFPSEQGWNLPSASHINPLRFWANIHFEEDLDWGKKLWTVFVEPETAPIPKQIKYTAKIFFIAPDAPHHFLKAGNKFMLCIGNLPEAPAKATGLIISCLDN